MKLAVLVGTLHQGLFTLPFFVVTASYLVFPGRGVDEDVVPVDSRHFIGMASGVYFYLLVEVANGVAGYCTHRRMAAADKAKAVMV